MLILDIQVVFKVLGKLNDQIILNAHKLIYTGRILDGV